MNIGLITVRGPGYHPNRRLTEAATSRGHTVICLHPYRKWPAYLQPGPAATLIEAKNDLRKLHVVLPRQGADVGPSCLPLIYQLEQLEIPIVNGFDAVRLSRHQFYTLQALAKNGLPFPETVFVNSVEGFHHAVESLGGYPLVVKQVSERQGQGVFKVKSPDGMPTPIKKQLEQPQKNRRGFLVQRHIEPQGRKDIRVLVMGKDVIAAQVLTPMPGDFRSNAHIGGRGYVLTLTEEIEKISIKATAAVGLDIAGVDLMVPKDESPMVGEVNYSPGFKVLEETTGIDIAGKIIDFAGKKAGLKLSAHRTGDNIANR